MDDPDKLDVAPDRAEVVAEHGGFVTRVDALSVGRAVLALGGGRERKGEAIDHGVGVELLKKPGEAVKAGEAILRLYHRGGRGLERAQSLLRAGLETGPQAPAAAPLILGHID